MKFYNIIWHWKQDKNLIKQQGLCLAAQPIRPIQAEFANLPNWSVRSFTIHS